MGSAENPWVISAMGLQELLHQALDAQNSGKLAEAERLYLAVLAADPAISMPIT